MQSWNVIELSFLQTFSFSIWGRWFNVEATILSPGKNNLTFLKRHWCFIRVESYAKTEFASNCWRRLESCSLINRQKFFTTAFALIDRLHDFKKASIVICTFFKKFSKKIKKQVISDKPQAIASHQKDMNYGSLSFGPLSLQESGESGAGISGNAFGG